MAVGDEGSIPHTRNIAKNIALDKLEHIDSLILSSLTLIYYKGSRQLKNSTTPTPVKSSYKNGQIGNSLIFSSNWSDP